MATTLRKTLHGKCPRCCPDGGACFNREYVDGEWVKKCSNCHLVLVLRKLKAPTGPNRRQARVLETLHEAGWTTQTRMIGRNLWVNANHSARSMWKGDSMFGTVGPRGKMALTLQRIGGDLKITDYWGLRESMK